MLYGIPDYNINRLQRIENSAARLVTNTRKYDNITPILQNLNWLPVRQRIHSKIELITYESITDILPKYLCELISIIKSPQKLRSSSQILLQVPISQLKTYGAFIFGIASPSLWNMLPADITSGSSLENFKYLLKHTCSRLLWQINNKCLLNLLFVQLFVMLTKWRCTEWMIMTQLVASSSHLH